jgi:hypothetical protein
MEATNPLRGFTREVGATPHAYLVQRAPSLTGSTFVLGLFGPPQPVFVGVELIMPHRSGRARQAASRRPQTFSRFALFPPHRAPSVLTNSQRMALSPAWRLPRSLVAFARFRGSISWHRPHRPLQMASRWSSTNYRAPQAGHELSVGGSRPASRLGVPVGGGRAGSYSRC